MDYVCQKDRRPRVFIPAADQYATGTLFSYISGGRRAGRMGGLARIGGLAGLVRSYIELDGSYAPNLPAQWNALAAAFERSDVLYETDFRDTKIAYEARTPQAVYKFEGNHLPWRKIEEYVASMDDAIAYVKDWFEFDYDGKLDVTLRRESRNIPSLSEITCDSSELIEWYNIYVL